MAVRKFFAIIMIFPLFFLSSPVKAGKACPPTRSDAEGPFYKAWVPLRNKTGTGLIIEGMVRNAGSCEAIAGARVEWWQTNPAGRYDDDHRGALISDSEGRYRLETDFPPPYSRRPSHVHFKVFAPGNRTLTTQVYPEKGQTTLQFDFILIAK